MTKIQLKILEAQKRAAQITGAARYFFALKILFLEVLVVLHKIGSHIVLGKHKTFEKFAERNEHGVITDSFTKHERFHRVSLGGTTLAIALGILYAFGGVLIPTKSVLYAASLVVNDNGDAGDGVCDSSCTLRDAIVNANASPGVDSVSFDAGMTISLTSALPDITETISIDGDVDSDGDPDIVIDGASAGSADGFSVVTNDASLSGLVIQGFSGAGISIQGNDNTVSNNYIGTNLGGSAANANAYGVLLDTGSSGNIIGGTNTGSICTAPCNLIAGNDTDIRIQGAAQGNFVQGNVFGLTLDMSKPIVLDNNGPGVSIGGGAFSNIIGGNRDENASEIGQGNVFGGYADDSDHDGSFDGSAIQIDTDGFDSGSSTGNSIFGNLIGLNGSGTNTDAFNNVTGAAGADGINDLRNNAGINTVADNTEIGDGTALHRNAISGNLIGVSIKANSGIDDITVIGNYIGLDKTGETPQYPAGYIAVGGPYKFYYGILAHGTSGLTIRENIISDFPRKNFSGNTAWGYGVYFGSTSLSSPNGDNTGATIAANKFGTDKDGVTAHGNITSIACEQLSSSLVGGAADSERNIISSSGESFDGGPFEVPSLVGETSGCHDNIIRNNYIGTTASGNNALTNGAAVSLRRGANNITIQNNLFGDFSGHALVADSASFLSFHDNTFGFGANGTTSFSIGGNGAIVVSKTTDSTIDSNQVGNATYGGIVVTDSKTLTIQNNFIGTDSTETKNFANGGGIDITNSSSVDVVGNVAKNNIELSFEKYFLANSYFSYSGNEYSDIIGTNNFECLPGQKGVHTIEYNATYGTITFGEICTDNQVFLGSTLLPGSNESNLNTNVKAYLISKAGSHYTFIVSQPDAGPYTCSTIASSLVSGGTCDQQFTLFTRSGGDYTTQSLPTGTSLGSSATEPVMSHESYASGISILGANGDLLVQDNHVMSNASNGVNILGGNGVAFDQNTVSNNDNDGVDVIGSKGNTLTSNTIENNGDNGVKCSETVESAIGSSDSADANSITGNDVNGILFTSGSDTNTITKNTITGNGNVSTVTGSGIALHESSSNTIYGNTVNTNVFGISIDSSDATASTGNIIGGTTTGQPNTINSSTSSGVVIQDHNTQGNQIIGNTIDSNHGYGIDNVDTHSAGATTPTNGDNLLQGNTILSSTLSGIRNKGASPKIISNTLQENSAHGIYNIADYGTSTNPTTESDDVLSTPQIGATGTKNILNGNTSYGIYSLDTAPSNKSTLVADNTFDSNNTSGRIRQDWYGLVKTLGTDGNPEAGADVKIFGQGITDPLFEFTTATNGFGPSSASTSDVQTWQVIPEFAVSPSGTLQTYTPQTIVGTGSAGTTTFSFNGETLGGSSDFGNINGRYQVATVELQPDPNSVQGTVYDDVNRNGANNSEAGLASVPVRIYLDDGNGAYGSEDALIDSVTSDTNGAYIFSNLSNGDYFVVADAPSGKEKTSDNPSTKITFDALNGGEVATQNFGFANIPDTGTPLGTIKGTVFDDTDKDKAQDTGEAGIADVTIHLFEDTNANGTFDTGTDTEVATSTSVSGGGYAFNNLGLNTYFLSFAIPTSYELTTANNPTAKEQLTTDGQIITVNFGLVKPATTPPTIPPTTPPPTPIPPPIKPTSGGTKTPPRIAPITGASTDTTTASAGAVALALLNLLLAVPGSMWPAFLRLLADLFSEPLLALFGSKKLPWGRVINSVTKAPIDLGIVRLYDARTRSLVGTAVTDTTGRFKFFPKTGVYTAKALKTNFVFPSHLLAAAPEPEKRNLYFGDQIRIDDQHPTFTKDIPMDTAEASQDIKTILRLRLKRIAHTVVAFSGIAISIINIITIPSLLTVGLLFVHILLFFIFWRLALPKKPKPWGRVYDATTKKPIRGANVYIYDERFGRLLDIAVTDRNGRYGFLVGAAEYSLVVKARGYAFPGHKKELHDYIGGALRVTVESAVTANIPLEPTEEEAKEPTPVTEEKKK